MYWQDSHPLPFWLKTRHKVELVLATLFLLPRTQSMGRRGTEHKRSDITLPRRITARINVAITAASRSCNCAPWKVCGCTVLEVPDLRSSTPSVDTRLESGTRNEIETKSYLTYAPSVNRLSAVEEDGVIVNLNDAVDLDSSEEEPAVAVEKPRKLEVSKKGVKRGQPNDVGYKKHKASKVTKNNSSSSSTKHRERSRDRAGPDDHWRRRGVWGIRR